MLLTDHHAVINEWILLDKLNRALNLHSQNTFKALTAAVDVFAFNV